MLTAGTHNATLVQLNGPGAMFFHNFIYTPLPTFISVTSTVTTAGRPSATSNSASTASTTGAAVSTSSSHHSPVGPIVGGVIGILVIAILAGLWFRRQKHQPREGGGDAHENTGAAAYRRSFEQQDYRETSTTILQRPFSFGHSQSTVDAQHMDIEALPDQQRAATTTTTQTPPITLEVSSQEALLAPPGPPNTTNPNQLEIIERLIGRNVPRQDIAAIVRTMAAAGPSGSGTEANGDQQRAEAVQRQPNTHISEMEIEMPRQEQELPPPVYNLIDGGQN
ncbi:hypothetical protein FRB94_004674 [Tulasnella sp. JGI-2019a]|nr:hypothetical protein FRB94_004674 [Tulasnella sp. JGI-2019a]